MNDTRHMDALDSDLIRQHEALRKRLDRMARRNMDTWDPENPRTVQEYLDNNRRRRESRERRVSAWINRLFIGSLLFWGAVCTLALLIG